MPGKKAQRWRSGIRIRKHSRCSKKCCPRRNGTAYSSFVLGQQKTGEDLGNRGEGERGILGSFGARHLIRTLPSGPWAQLGVEEGHRSLGDGWIAEVRIPYTFVPAQNAWINGVDLGRYRVGIDTAPPQTICIRSEAARVQRRLEYAVLGTIDFWDRVWKERGIIPSGWHTPTGAASGWDLMNCLRMVCRTGIDWKAHSVRRLPTSGTKFS